MRCRARARAFCACVAFVGIFNFTNCLTDNTMADLNTIHSEITLNSFHSLMLTVLCSIRLQIACEIAQLILSFSVSVSRSSFLRELKAVEFEIGLGSRSVRALFRVYF